MEFDFSKMSSTERYKLLTSTVIPRPIALVSTIDEQGILNAAPYSFFNMFAENPATCVLGIQRRPDGKYKDTSRIIRETGEFVINLVDMNLAEGMNISAIDFDPEYDEFELSGFTALSSRLIKPPRIAESPVSFECRRTVTLQLNAERDLVVGEVLTMHARDGLINPKTLHLDQAKYEVVGRLYADLYTRIRDVFSLRRWSPEDWLKEKGISNPLSDDMN